MTLEKKLLTQSIGFSFFITLLLIVIAYLPVWEIMNEKEREIFPIYGAISSVIIFIILTAVFYFDISENFRKKIILKRIISF